MQRSITYLPVKSKDDVTHLRVDVYYSQGGYNLSTYQEEQRGYYLSVSPVSRSKLCDASTERYLAFSGRKRLLLPVNRKSPKRYETALQLAQESRRKLIDIVCQEQGLELME